MKVLLIQPPIQDFYQTSIRTQPIGLAYLAASLQKYGHEVEILDCQTGKRRTISIPSEFSYLKDFYPFNDQSPFKLYTGYYHFGMDWDEIRQSIKASKADVFGISSSFTPYHGEALEIARIIEEWDSKKVVVMGGAHVSCDPEGVMKSPFVDYVILGEGEIRFPVLLESLERGGLGGIDGIGYRRNGAVRIHPLRTFIQDLDIVPHPARELFDMDRYRIKKKRSTMIITSRGCPHGCVYCSSHLIMGNFFRTRSVENIIHEMTECLRQYGIQVFDIEDDNCTFDKNRAKRLMNLIIQTFGEQSIELTAMNGVSFISMDEELLKLMKQAGFRTLNLSFVSTDSFLKERMKRPRLDVDFKDIADEAEKVGLNVVAYAILGMPDQTIEEMLDTLIYLMGKRILIGPSIYYPTPGTDLFKRCKEMDILPSHCSQWRSSALPIETKEFSRLDIVTLFRLTRAINFIKEKMDEGELNEGMTLHELFHVLQEKKNTNDNVITWADLLLLFIKEKSFFGLNRNSVGKASIFKEGSSKKVLNRFLEKGWKKPILKSRLD